MKLSQKQKLLVLGFSVFLVAGAIISYSFDNNINYQTTVETRGKITYSTDYKNKEVDCLAEAIWHEARGETDKGMLAVANVIQNRVHSELFPNSYCKVINQPRQFSYKRSAVKVNKLDKQYKKAQLIAENVIEGKVKPVLSSKVMWYAHKRVSNYWTSKKKKVAVIGNHVFYAKAGE